MPSTRARVVPRVSDDAISTLTIDYFISGAARHFGADTSVARARPRVTCVAMSCLGYALRRAARARAVSLVITGPESSFVIPIDRHQRWCRGANPSRTASASGGAAPGFRRWSLKPSPGVAGIHSACVARSALNDDTKHTNIHQAPAPTAVLALGSNQGDRVGVFRESYRLLNARGIFVVSHAGLYETEPQYVTDQPVFLNSACLVSIQDKDIGDCPQKLLAVLKQIEKQLGRVESGARFGPRPMDLDILFHSSGAHKTESLEIPHPRIHERDFVLAPLADLKVGCYDRPGADGVESRSVDSQSGVSNNSAKSDAIQAGLRSAKQTWRDRGGETNVGKKGLKRVLPLGKENTLTQVGGATKIMAILNVTHDSFSGDGVLGEGGCDSNRNNESVEDFWNPVDLGKIVARASAMVKNGARVVDVGGQSTRPGAVRLSKQEELRRVLPVVKALAALFQREEFQHRGGENVPLISVDTFYGDVAFEAVNAGADIINDVSGKELSQSPSSASLIGPITLTVYYW